MDKTTKFILGLIAVSLIGINIQMWNGKLIKDAHAVRLISGIRFNVCYQEDGSFNARGFENMNPYNERWGRCN